MKTDPSGHTLLLAFFAATLVGPKSDLQGMGQPRVLFLRLLETNTALESAVGLDQLVPGGDQLGAALLDQQIAPVGIVRLGMLTCC
jgi:hypothetical protein